MNSHALNIFFSFSTRASRREEKKVQSFAEGLNRDHWVECAFESEGAYFISTMALSVMNPAAWKAKRITFLQRLLVVNHARSVGSSGPKVNDKSIQDWSVYKSAAVYWGLLDALYKFSFSNVPSNDQSDWGVILAEYIRHNDQALIEASGRLLSFYQDKLLRSTSLESFFEAVELDVETANPSQFIGDILASLP